MFKKILVGTDGSDSATRAVSRAAEIARQANAELLVLHAYGSSNVGHSLAVDIHPQVARGKAVLDEVQRTYENDLHITTLLRQGDAAAALLDAAEEEDVDLIVVGNKGMTGTGRFLMGSVPNRVSHHAPCDLLIVHTTP